MYFVICEIPTYLGRDFTQLLKEHLWNHVLCRSGFHSGKLTISKKHLVGWRRYSDGEHTGDGEHTDDGEHTSGERVGGEHTGEEHAGVAWDITHVNWR